MNFLTMSIALIAIVAVIGSSLFLNLILEGREEQCPCLSRIAKWSLRIIALVIIYIIWKYNLWC